MSEKALTFDQIQKAAEKATEETIAYKSSAGITFQLKPSASREYFLKSERVEKGVRARSNTKRNAELSTVEKIDVMYRAYFGTYVTGWDLKANGDNGELVDVRFDEDNFVGLCINAEKANIGLFGEIGTAINSHQEEAAENLKAHSGN